MYIQTRFSSRFCLFNDQMGPLSQLLKKKQWIRWVTWADPQNGGGSKRLKLKALFIQCSFEECFSVRIFIHQHFHGALNRKPPYFSSDPWLKFDIPHALIVLCFVLVQSTFSDLLYMPLRRNVGQYYSGFELWHFEKVQTKLFLCRSRNKYTC